jgi:hypothetical protein
MPPSTARQQASYDGDLVTDLKPDDVVLGRGMGPYEHTGNAKFREIICDFRSEYLAANKRMTKDKIAHKAIQIIKARKGRFIRKMEYVYVIVDEKTAVEKTKQALRFQGRKKHGDSNEDQRQEDRIISPSAASVGIQARNSGLPTHFVESQPQGSRVSSPSAYPTNTNPGQPRPS